MPASSAMLPSEQSGAALLLGDTAAFLSTEWTLQHTLATPRGDRWPLPVPGDRAGIFSAECSPHQIRGVALATPRCAGAALMSAEWTPGQGAAAGCLTPATDASGAVDGSYSEFLTTEWSLTGAGAQL